MARRVVKVQYPLCTSQNRSKKVRRVPMVTEQSQICIKRSLVSGALLTIIPSYDCRGAEYETADQSRDEIKWSECAPRKVEQTYRFKF